MQTPGTQKKLKPPFLPSSALTQHDLSSTNANILSDSRCPPVPKHDALLPAIYYTEDRTALMPEDDVPAFLNHDLDVARLNHIHKKLWLAGRPMNYNSLCRQKMMKREIVITEQTDLHLTWSESTILVKPFPRYLGDYDFWIAHLCQFDELHGSACGFLFSYTSLIGRESDFNLGRELGLVPQMPWTQWRAYIQDVRRTIDAKPLDQINHRYLYGELRLPRLNWIYRLYGRRQDRSLIRGYVYNYRTYSSFFVRNFAWIFVVFIYATIVLTAMQVGLATERLQPSRRFQDASYGFVIFSIVVPLIIAGTAAAIFLFLFLHNLAAMVLSGRHSEKGWRAPKKGMNRTKVVNSIMVQLIILLNGAMILLAWIYYCQSKLIARIIINKLRRGSLI